MDAIVTTAENTTVTNVTELIELTTTEESITTPKSEEWAVPVLFLVGLTLLCVIKVGLDIRYVVKRNNDKKKG